MKQKLFTAVLLLAVLFMNAQNSAVAAGSEARGNGGTSSQSIGLTAYRSDFGESGSSLQGMQHAYEIFEITDKSDDVSGNFRISVYPNPTEDLVNVEFQNAEVTNLSYQVVTLEGKLLSSGKLSPDNAAIPMKTYPAGIYLVKFNHSGKNIKTFKIIKNQ